MPRTKAATRRAKPTSPIGLAALLVLALILVVAARWVASRNDSAAAPAKAQTKAASPAKSTSGPAKPTSQGSSGLPTVRLASLPAQAQTTVRLIASNGPFPYSRDGVVFSNREGTLPKKTSGYYHEYTVVTPGSSDRGARRVIAGRDGEEFYTDDHYATFREILR